jgi:arabinan endo-1,5-alpha-L-arabinosidase
VIGPGHCGVFSAQGLDLLVHHYYDGFEYGRPTLQIRPLIWDADGWPSPGKPMPSTSPSTKP